MQLGVRKVGSNCFWNRGSTQLNHFWNRESSFFFSPDGRMERKFLRFINAHRRPRKRIAVPWAPTGCWCTPVEERMTASCAAAPSLPSASPRSSLPFDTCQRAGDSSLSLSKRSQQTFFFCAFSDKFPQHSSNWGSQFVVFLFFFFLRLNVTQQGIVPTPTFSQTPQLSTAAFPFCSFLAFSSVQESSCKDKRHIRGNRQKISNC